MKLQDVYEDPDGNEYLYPPCQPSDPPRWKHRAAQAIGAAQPRSDESNRSRSRSRGRGDSKNASSEIDMPARDLQMEPGLRPGEVLIRRDELLHQITCLKMGIECADNFDDYLKWVQKNVERGKGSACCD